MPDDDFFDRWDAAEDTGPSKCPDCGGRIIHDSDGSGASWVTCEDCCESPYDDAGNVRPLSPGHPEYEP